jgi:hypothetical protein
MISIIKTDFTSPTVEITKPEKALYLFNMKIRGYLLKRAHIIGRINISVEASDDESGIDYVEFIINGRTVHRDDKAPYSHLWKWGRILRHRHTLEVVAYDNAGNSARDQIKIKRHL